MFKLVSNFQPTGDQPKAIKALVDGIKNHKDHQVLLGVYRFRENIHNGQCNCTIKSPCFNTFSY